MMRRRIIVLTVLCMLALALTPAWAQGRPTRGQGPPASGGGSGPTAGQAIHHDTSPPLSEMAIPAVRSRGLTVHKEVPIMEKPDLGRDPSLAEPDGGLQSEYEFFFVPTPSPIISFPGLSEADNVATVNVAIVPPDTNGDIGLDEAGNSIYIQYINLTWAVYDANTGTLTNGPFAGNTFWTGFGGFCETNNNGDPVVLYDDTAGRWLFSQFSINQGIQCVAVSTTSDPLGPYHRYAFVVTPGGNNDYPKLGVWDDGTTGSTGQSAYTFTTRDFPVGSTFGGTGVMERDAMLSGAAAQFIKFSNPCVAGDCIEGQLPPHLAGPTPPAGTCPTFWSAVDAAFDDSPFANDGYRNHTLCVDWSNTANSTYTEGPLVIAGSNFDRFLAGNSVSPVNGGEALDALQFFTMYRAQYRWFGDNARVVLNTTVDAGDDRAGIRWAETRSVDGDSGWFLQQDGTFAPADGLERWMGSIAQDKDGNIALGYSVTGDSLFPSVRYTSRGGGDPAGTLPGGEVSCHEGTGAQIGSSNRWGDYSSMSVDPIDDCTFWYTQEYYENTGSFDFNTRICSFSLDGCGGECEPTETPETSCEDGLDNDCDGDFDCFDSDCDSAPACACVPVDEICDNGTDDDCDGLIDCEDPDCDADPACFVPPAPDNDDCIDAIELLCGDTASGTTTAATFDDVGFCGTSNTAPGVWYKVAHNGLITASTCNQADYDTKLSAFDGECGALGCIGGNDDGAGCAGFTSELTWPSDGSENLVLVHGFGTATGDFDLTVTCEDPAENDDCEDAIGPLAVDSVTSGTTTTATVDEPPDIDCGTTVTAPGVWYEVTGTGNTMTASTCNDGDALTGGADYDKKISVFCADCETKECIGGQDDNGAAGCAGFSTKFDWPTKPGSTYKVLVHGFGSATGDFDLAILDDGVPAEGANDCDGVPEDFDYCADTVIPESVPTRRLGVNRWALTDEDNIFDTRSPRGEGPGLSFTTADTAGCSCEQIIDELDLGVGHRRFGCSISAMQDWMYFLEDQSCGNCVESHLGLGCEVAECETEVCDLDPFCCDVAWDGICVGEAIDLCTPDICLALPASNVPLTYSEGRAPEVIVEPVSKDPNYTPKE